jgi:diguanylate cyclase (GGDEF)-like protein
MPLNKNIRNGEDRMNRYIKLGYEGIELELPVHALYLYRESEQLLSNIIPLITEGNERKERCIFVGSEEDSKFLKKKFKKQITCVSKGIHAPDFIPWIKSEYDKLPKQYQGLRVFLESDEEYLGYEDILDDFNTQPDLRLFLLCQYKIKNLSSGQLLDILKIHPYVFVEHLLKPNCFYSRVKHRIWLDPLTGIFNRRYFENQLSKELQRASRYEHTLSILFIDIDQFKRINDEFGHQIGDHVLEQLSEILERSVRSVDVVARYGGDEFIVLLPETKKAHALKTANRILDHVKNFDFFKDELKVKDLNISIGVAGFPEDAGGTYELIKKADNALYHVKKGGGGKAYACE